MPLYIFITIKFGLEYSEKNKHVFKKILLQYFDRDYNIIPVTNVMENKKKIIVCRLSPKSKEVRSENSSH